MAVAAERYIHFVRTSGGAHSAMLTLDGGTATVEFYSGGMASSKREFRMRFRVKRFSDRYGLLSLTEVERLDSPQKLTAVEINEAVFGFHEEDDERAFYWGVGYEYLRLKGGEDHIPNDPNLWEVPSHCNGRMDLILFARISAPDLIEGGVNPEIATALLSLDRMKFEVANQT